MALTRTDTVESDDLTVLFKYGDSDYRAAPMSALVSYLNGALTFPAVEWVTQYAAPSATGFTVAMTSDSLSRHLILTPAAGYAAGTITLPLASGCVDGQMVMVNCTQAVTTFTIGANGASAVVGAPTTLAANAYFTLKYDITLATWYRVG